MNSALNSLIDIGPIRSYNSKNYHRNAPYDRTIGSKSLSNLKIKMISRDDDQSTTGRRTGDIRRVYGGSELHFELTDVA